MSNENTRSTPRAKMKMNAPAASESGVARNKKYTAASNNIDISAHTSFSV
jgi:hypothetical protein